MNFIFSFVLCVAPTSETLHLEFVLSVRDIVTKFTSTVERCKYLAKKIKTVHGMVPSVDLTEGNNRIRRQRQLNFFFYFTQSRDSLVSFSLSFGARIIQLRALAE